MICISGFSGAGKDAVASNFVSLHKAIQIGLADAAKRHMADTYGFSELQLFGPSEFRNAGDLRHPKIPNFYSYATESKYCFGNEPEGLNSCLKPGMKYYSVKGPKLPPSDLFNGGLPHSPYVVIDDEVKEILIEANDPSFWLSPREALQKYCELMNKMYLYTWSSKAISIHEKLGEVVHYPDGDRSVKFEKGYINKEETYHEISEPFWARKYSYTKMGGLVKNTELRYQDLLFPKKENKNFTCFADFRHVHEIIDVNNFEEKSNSTVILIRVKRPSVPEPPYNHRSETEQVRIPDKAFDFIVNNDGTQDDLYHKVEEIVKKFTDPKWKTSRDKECVVEIQKGMLEEKNHVRY